MNVVIRPAEPDRDYQAIAALQSLAQPEPVTAERLREFDRDTAPGTFRRRFVAETAAGRLIGYGHVARHPWMPAGEFWMAALIHPEYRGQGAGGNLYQRLHDLAIALSAEHLRAQVADNDLPSLHFAEQRGYTVERHVFESVLDLWTFDETSFRPDMERVLAGGIRFTTLAELGDTPAHRRRWWELHKPLGADVPGPMARGRRLSATSRYT